MRLFFAAAALLSLVNVVHAEDLAFDVRSGQTGVKEMYIYMGNCVSAGQFRTKVLKEPAHGTLVVRRETFIANEPPCQGRKFVGTKFYYTSAKGFRGTDHLSVNLGYPIDSSELQYSYTTYDVTLNVR
ncbi:hypothetical protein [Pleomorphomonas koreensis]|uniref:hypothetical protein n=1 Tax=Pleomorphomonas koreensis TaxID=257440 RepID=UPI00042784AF|nr:hypothetical protein [Pleomorphomonas koreensis]